MARDADDRLMTHRRSIGARRSARAWLESRLAPGESAALAKQGFICPSKLPSGTSISKLRFRNSAGRQKVLYLGRDPVWVAAVRAEVGRRQATVRRRRNLHRLDHRAKSLLRQTKQRLAPYLIAAGYRFHGYSMRRTRAVRDDSQPPPRLTGGAPQQGAEMTQDELPTDAFFPCEPPVVVPPPTNGARPADPALAIHAAEDEKLAAFRKKAIEEPDPFRSMLLLGAARMFESGGILHREAVRVVVESPDRLAALEEVEPILNQSFQAHRQAERFCQVGARESAREAKQRNAKFSHTDTYGHLPTREREPPNDPLASDDAWELTDSERNALESEDIFPPDS